MNRNLGWTALPRIILTFSLLLPFLACAEAETDSEVQAAEASIPQTEAEAALTTTLAEAERTNRLVFVHSGAPW